MIEAAGLSFRPVDRSTWADFERLFTGPGGPKHCWCMVWRATAEEGRGTSGPVRHGQIHDRIERGVPVGLLAYEGDLPVAWVSIAPRETYRRLNGPGARPGEIIWSLACMFTPRKRRGAGTTHRLIAASAEHARKAGANVLEAYPVADDAPSYRFMGIVSAFSRAGFTEIGMAGTRRHVMRLWL
ncbi:MAG TPA: GNAT family N-acetyltransferase [Devosiaceae bacterium]|nr:GNAT family N-acetyltransferase [Devosiaceae bacterium]